MSELELSLTKYSQRQLWSYQGTLLGAVIGYKIGTSTRNFNYVASGQAIPASAEHDKKTMQVAISLVDGYDPSKVKEIIGAPSSTELAMYSIPLGLCFDSRSLSNLLESLKEIADCDETAAGAAALASTIIYAREHPSGRPGKRAVIDYLGYNLSHHFNGSFMQTLFRLGFIEISKPLEELKDFHSLIPIFYYLQQRYSFDIAMRYTKHFLSDESDLITAMTGAIAGAQDTVYSMATDIRERLSETERDELKDLAEKLFLKFGKPEFKDNSTTLN